MYLGIIADDLTGAADTGIQFAKRGIHTILLPFGLGDIVPSSCLHEAGVVALNTSTRGMEAKLAYHEVRNAASLLMRTFHPQNIYKKIDSTLRGNLGAEIEAVMDATGNEFAILAPAFPAHSRTTVHGVHLVNGQPVSRTEAALDPVSPVAESHLPTLIRSQTELKVGHIDLGEIRRGTIALQRSIVQRMRCGERMIVFDAATDDDLSSIAEATMLLSSSPLMVGSAGLANQLVGTHHPPDVKGLRPFQNTGVLGGVRPLARAREQSAMPPSKRREHIKKYITHESVIIIISGSLSVVTSRQLNQVRKTGRGKIIPIQVHRLIEEQETDSERDGVIASEIISATKSNRVVGIQSVRDDLRSRHSTELSRLVVEYLGRTAFQIVRNCSQAIQGMILSGGDTALSVFKHMGISHVRLIDEILPGIPYGQVADGEFAGLIIVTKAGAFGDENALVECIDFLVG